MKELYLEFQRDTGYNSEGLIHELNITKGTYDRLSAYITWLEIFWLENQEIRIDNGKNNS